MTFEAEDGTIETPAEELAVGDAITLNGEPANGTFRSPDGMIDIVAVDGLIAELIPVDAEDNANAELDQLKAEFEALKSENETLKAENNTLKSDSEAVVAELEKLANVKSTYTPPAQAQAFRKVEDNNVKKSIKEQAQEKRANYKQK
jgi:hypothetical protein